MPRINTDDPAELYRLGRILEKAADFEDDQWCQGATAADAAGNPVALKSPLTARNCILGRLHLAANGHQPTIRFLHNFLGGFIPAPHHILFWNDRPDRQAAEVRDLLNQGATQLYRKAAAMAADEAAAGTVPPAGKQRRRRSPKPTPASAANPPGQPHGEAGSPGV